MGMFFFLHCKYFTVTFDQFNASLLNKSINFFKKYLSMWICTLRWFIMHEEFINPYNSFQHVSVYSHSLAWQKMLEYVNVMRCPSSSYSRWLLTACHDVFDCEIVWGVFHVWICVALFSLVVNRVWVGILHWLVYDDRVTPSFNKLHKVGNVILLNSHPLIRIKAKFVIHVCIKEVSYLPTLQEWLQAQGSLFGSPVVLEERCCCLTEFSIAVCAVQSLRRRRLSRRSAAVWRWGDRSPYPGTQEARTKHHPK